MELIRPFHFGELTNIGYGIMVGVNFLFLLFILFQKKIYRWQGALFLLVYVGYWIYLSMSFIDGDARMVPEKGSTPAKSASWMTLPSRGLTLPRIRSCSIYPDIFRISANSPRIAALSCSETRPVSWIRILS